jgi:hypothetical protein
MLYNSENKIKFPEIAPTKIKDLKKIMASHRMTILSIWIKSDFSRWELELKF